MEVITFSSYIEKTNESGIRRPHGSHSINPCQQSLDARFYPAASPASRSGSTVSVVAACRSLSRMATALSNRSA